MLLTFYIFDLNDNMRPISYALNWHLFKLSLFERTSAWIGLDSREHDDNCDLGPDLRLAGDAYELQQPMLLQWGRNLSLVYISSFYCSKP